MKNFMIDIETLGTTLTAPIFNITAVLFDERTGEKQQTFSQNIDIDSLTRLGYVVEKDTLNWWLAEERRNLFVKFMSDTLPAREAMNELYTFISGFSKLSERKVWAKGAAFDIAMVRNLFNKTGFYTPPWQYRYEHCARTLFNQYPAIKNAHTFVGDPHDPVHDANNQIDLLVKILNHMHQQNFNHHAATTDTHTAK